MTLKSWAKKERDKYPMTREGLMYVFLTTPFHKKQSLAIFLLLISFWGGDDFQTELLASWGCIRVQEHHLIPMITPLLNIG